MPTYNRPYNIEHRITMIIQQTFFNWVLLIIDDGSTLDNKQKFNNIKQKYNLNDKILFLENETNCHIAKTLNIGIDYLLTNDFTHFTWISDDNDYYPDFLNILVSNNNYFTYSSFNTQMINNKIRVNKTEYLNYKQLITKWGGCGSFMWTKKAIQEIGYYNESVPCCEDYEYLIRTFKINPSECYFIDIPLMKYIFHTDSLYEINKPHLFDLKHKIDTQYIDNN